MRKTTMLSWLLSALFPCMAQVFAETIDVRLRIRQKKSEEKTITRENLITIQRFILHQGKRETYCNMYNDNPAYQTEGYRFYLNPDSGQKNIDCDPAKSGFHNLTIRQIDGGSHQYRTVEFLERHFICITTNWPADDLTVGDIRRFVVAALEEILIEIEKKANKKPVCCGFSARSTQCYPHVL
jgi:hypothetical protein